MKRIKLILLAIAVVVELTGLVLISIGEPPALGISILVVGVTILVIAILLPPSQRIEH